MLENDLARYLFGLYRIGRVLDVDRNVEIIEDALEELTAGALLGTGLDDGAGGTELTSILL